VTPAAASTANSTITASPNPITADGLSTSTITVRLKDAFFNNLATSGGTVALSKTGGGVLSAVTDNANGTYTATLTSPLTPGTATVSGTLNGNPLVSSVVVTFGAVLPGPADPTKSTIAASPTAIQADGVTTSTITVRLKDAAGLNLTSGGDTVELAIASGGTGTLVPVSPAPATDNSDGTYTAVLTSPVTVGSATITGTLNGAAMTDTATVNFTAGPPPPPGPADPTTSTITASPLTIVGDGVTTSTITVRLKDASGTSLTAGGDAVVLSASPGGGTLSAWRSARRRSRS
jgi:adhesin/invasin